MEERIKYEMDVYVKKYAAKHKISEEEARKHAMVKIAEHYFGRKNNEYKNN